MYSRQSSTDAYSRSELPVELDPDFPISMFQWSVEHDPIRDVHAHDVLEIGICLRGNGIIVIGNTIQPYERGDIVAIGPGIHHHAKSGFGVNDMWYFVHFDPSDWSVSAYPRDVRSIFRSDDDMDLYPLISMLIKEVQNKAGDYQSSVRGLITTITVRLGRLKWTHWTASTPCILGLEGRIWAGRDSR